MSTSQYCPNHPTEKIFSKCNHCSEYYCPDCLTEGGDYYYCNKSKCQEALRQITLPGEISCRYCKTKLSLSLVERQRGRFDCPSCWHVYKWPESHFFLTWQGLQSRELPEPIETQPLSYLPETKPSSPSSSEETPEGFRLIRMIFTTLAAFWALGFWFMWLVRKLYQLITVSFSYQRYWQDPLLFWSLLIALIITVTLWRTGRIQEFFTRFYRQPPREPEL